MKAKCSALLAVAVCLLLAGCLEQGGNQTFADGYYRFVHVSPRTDALNISANGSSIVSSLAYHVASPYIQLGWGTPEIKVQSATSGATYVDAQVPVAGGARYTYFLYGGGSSVVSLSVRDDITDAASGSFNLRPINLATGIGPLDVYLLAPGSTVDASAPVFASVAYGLSNPYTQVTNGNYDVVVTPTGSKEVIYDSGLQTFTGNSKVTVLMFATGSGKLVNAALLLSDANGTTSFIDNPVARFKFVGVAPDAQPVDVLIDDSVALVGVPYGGLSAYDTIAAGARNLKIQASNAPGSYLYNQTQTMAAASNNSLVAYSIQGTGNVGVLALQDNNLPPASGKANLRIVNACSDGTVYDVYANFGKLLSNVAQGTASAYQELDGATYTLSFTPAGTTTQAATLTTEMDAGHVYTIYLYGRTGSAAVVPTTDY